MPKEKQYSEVKLDKGREKHFFNMLNYYLRHPDIAAEELLGIKLSPHERIIAKAIFSGKNVDICAGRAMAKTFSIGVIGTIMAELLSGLKQRIGMWSGSNYRGGKIIFEDYVNKLINGEIKGQDTSKIYTRNECKTLHKGIAFKNKQDHLAINIGKSTMLTSPIGDGVRGFRALKKFLDERNTMDEAIISNVINPFSYHELDVHRDIRDRETFKFIEDKGVFGSQNISVGTPRYTEEAWTNKIHNLMQDYKDGDKVNEIIEKGKHIFFHINFLDSFKHAVNVPEMLEDLQNPSVPIEEAVAEIFGIPIKNSSSRFYSFEVMSKIKNLTVVSNKTGEITKTGIEKEEDKNESVNAVYSLGVDCAYGGSDKAFLTLTKLNKTEGFFDIVNVWEFDTSDIKAYEHMANLIKDLVFNKFSKSLKAIFYDLRGGGDTLKRELYKTSPLYPIPIILFDTPLEDKNTKQEIVGNRILYPFNASDRTNTNINNFFKAKLQTGLIRIPDYNILKTSKTKEVREKANLFAKISNQFKMVRRKPTKNYFNFDVPSGKHKDSYSATLYSFALFCFDEYKLEKVKPKKKRTLAKVYAGLNGKRR